VLQDFLARPGWTGGDPLPDPPYHQKGILDLQGQPKPAASVITNAYHATVRITAARDRR
jgi:hypothetical protein